MHTPRIRPLHIAALFGAILSFAAIPFAPYASFFLHVWWNEHAESSNTPRPTKPLRLIHNHGSPNEPVDTEAEEAALAPTAVNAINAESETLEPDPPNEFFDDGRPDMLSGRETAFNRWTFANAELWHGMDRQLQDCVYMKYVNAFGSSPERGIDECLAEAERRDAESGTRESLERYLVSTGAEEHLSTAVVDCAYNEYANNPDFTPEDAIGFCLE